MRAIEICRTAELGGHVDSCDQCGGLRISYNSCRNRHCPKCQCLEKERWLEGRKEDLLPTAYFHPVFTVPEGVKVLALRNQEVVYSILFRAASESLKELTKDPRHLGAEVIPCKGRFFLPVKVLSRLFRGKFLAYFEEAYEKGKLAFPGKIAHLREKTAFKRLLKKLYGQEWVVYCKAPFGSAETVMDYLGRYTHRVAISNDRLVKLEDDRVTFRYRDRQDNDRIKLMSLEAPEFIRRFLLHVLPDGFMKIRHYGILSNRSRKTKLPLCKSLLGLDCHREGGEKEKEPWQDLLTRITGIDPRICPYCGKGRMVVKEVLRPSPLPLPP
jgi:hypothetical protein